MSQVAHILELFLLLLGCQTVGEKELKEESREASL